MLILNVLFGVLKLDFTDESLVAACDFDGIGASEVGGQRDVALYINIGGEENVVTVLDLDGGAYAVVPCRQGVTVKVEDENGYGRAGVVTFTRMGKVNRHVSLTRFRIRCHGNEQCKQYK